MNSKPSSRFAHDRPIDELLRPLVTQLGETGKPHPQRSCGNEWTIRPELGDGTLWYLPINDIAAVVTLDLRARQAITLDARTSSFFCFGTFERTSGAPPSTHPRSAQSYCTLLGYAWRNGVLRGMTNAGESLAATAIYLLPEALTTIACAMSAQPAELASAIALLDGTRNLPRIIALCDELGAARFAPGCAEAYYRCKMVEICVHLVDWYRQAQTDPLPRLPAEDLTALNVARAWALAHLDAPISLDDLCQSACVSPTKLAALFKTAKNTTPMEWVRDQRMEHACKLLAQTANPLGSIAAQVGFTRHGSFSAAFKGRFGMTPNQFRALHRDERNATVLGGTLLDQ